MQFSHDTARNHAEKNLEKTLISMRASNQMLAIIHRKLEE